MNTNDAVVKQNDGEVKRNEAFCYASHIVTLAKARVPFVVKEMGYPLARV